MMKTNFAWVTLGMAGLLLPWSLGSGCTSESETLSATVTDDACQTCDDCCAGEGESLELTATGQTVSYAEGDDGNFQNGKSVTGEDRFGNCGDGTVVDKQTGLMWLTNASCVLSNYADFETDGAADGHLTWNQALSFIEEINAGERDACAAGFGDWRMPNVLELESLIDTGQENTTGWLMDQGFTLFEGNKYWTSTTVATEGGTIAWTIDFTYGSVHNETNKESVTVSVLPVRDVCSTDSANVAVTGQTESFTEGDDGAVLSGIGVGNATDTEAATDEERFTDNNDGTVSDNLTGLMWMQDTGCQGSYDWAEALEMAIAYNRNNKITTCENYNARYRDWRIPNRRELLSLIDFAQTSPAISEGHPLLNVDADDNTFWTSTTYGPDRNRAWQVDINSGQINMEAKTHRHRMILVR